MIEPLDNRPALLAGVLRSALDCIVVIDHDGRVVEFSPAAERTFGWSREEAVGAELAALLIPRELRARHRAALARAAQGYTGGLLDHRVELEALHRDGHRLPVELTVTKVEGSPLFAGFLRDLSSDRTAAAALHRSEQRYRIIAEAANDGIVVIDRDRRTTFVNNRLAELLGAPAERLLGRSLREFAAPQSLPVLDRAWSAAVPHGRTALDVHLQRVDGHVFWARVSVGAMTSPDGSFDGVVVVVTDIDERKREEERLRGQAAELEAIELLRGALDDDRLVLLGQPVVDLRTRAVLKHELLVRLRAEDGTLLGPGRFLPAAERLGLVRELDRWVVREAARRAAEGRHVAVNLSARSLALPEFVSVIERALSDAAAPPGNVVFEITETAALGNLEGARRFATRLDALGCGFALDDFGTGFGGFTYLKHLPIAFLKVDREFVRDLVHDDADRHVVETIVHLAGRFGATTIAEGAEDEETLSLLLDLGVDLAQGYALGPPTELIALPAR